MKPVVAIILIVVFLVVVIAVIVTIFPFSGVLCRSTGSILVSGDQGEHWFPPKATEEGKELTRASLLALEGHPSEPEVIYAGTEKRGLWRSSHGGSSWQKVVEHDEVLSPSATVYSIAPGAIFIDQEANELHEHFYVGVLQNGFGRILKTENGGITFKEVYVTTDEAGIFFVTLDPRNANIVWAGTGEGLLLRSGDGGETWEKIHEFRSIPSGIALNPSRPNELLVSTFERGIELSEDGGLTFTNLTGPLKPF